MQRRLGRKPPTARSALPRLRMVVYGPQLCCQASGTASGALPRGVRETQYFHGAVAPRMGGRELQCAHERVSVRRSASVAERRP